MDFFLWYHPSRFLFIINFVCCILSRKSHFRHPSYPGHIYIYLYKKLEGLISNLTFRDKNCKNEREKIRIFFFKKRDRFFFSKKLRVSDNKEKNLIKISKAWSNNKHVYQQDEGYGTRILSVNMSRKSFLYKKKKKKKKKKKNRYLEFIFLE